MSINVHVSGNPICINRGKMVTADSNCSKKEFEKRRLMRLEQVRQQSKNIAEDVRNKVKREKIIQMKQIEEEGKQKLKNWQNRKLLELQTQYKKALKELGTGHNDAKELVDQEKELEEQKYLNFELSTKRGHKAACKLHSQQQKNQRKKDTLVDRKKLVREIENTRAAMLSNFKKAKHSSEPRMKKKKHEEPNSDLNISIPDSDSQSSSNSLSNITEYANEDDEELSSSCTCALEDSDSSDVEDTAKKKSFMDSRYFEEKHPAIPLTMGSYVAPENTPRQAVSSRQFVHTASLQPEVTGNMHSIPPVPTYTKAALSSDIQFAPQSYVPSHTGSQYIPSAGKLYGSQVSQEQPSLDTRISDRIKLRDLVSRRRDIKTPEPVHMLEVQSSTAVRDFIHSRPCCRENSCTCCGNKRRDSRDRSTDRLGYDEGQLQDGFMDEKYTRLTEPSPQEVLKEHENFQRRSKHSDGSQSKISEIPSKPFIKLKSASNSDRNRKPTVLPKSPSKDLKQKTPPAKHKTSPSKVISSKKSLTKDSSKVAAGSSHNLIKPTSVTDDIDELTKPSGSRQHPIQVYDHPNRFGYEKNIPSASFVEKIPPESLEVITDPEVEENWLETQRRRYKDAQIRGRQALEKAKLQKEYEEMMRRLPLLQKKQRINEIYTDKPEYHMSDERLKERERIKQNNLENAYNKLFPDLKPAVVTLPKSQTGEEQGSSGADSVHSLNMANWDVDYKGPQMFSAQEVKDILRTFTRQDPKDRRTKLKELLKQLKLQKEELLREISNLPKDDSVDELINDLKSFDSEPEEKTKVKYKKKTPRKRSRKENEADISIDSCVESSSSELPKGKEVVGKSPRKKAKIKQKIIILQNTSTQTTPKPSTHEVPKVAVTSPSPPAQSKSPSICNKIHVPCDCNKENKVSSSDHMCHIFIKLDDDNKPEVTVKSKEEPTKPVDVKGKDVGIQISPELTKKQVKKAPLPMDSKYDSAMEKSRTWRENFSKNSVSTSSSSYLSPPDVQKFKGTEKSTDYFKKPQQKELSETYSSRGQESSHDDLTDPRVVLYVKKLLSMTRVSVDNLSVSTSNVETPSESLIEIESNNPKDRLQVMIDSFKNRMENVIEGLSYSPDYSPVPFNTSISGSSSHKDTAPKSAVPEKDSSSSTKSKSKEHLLANIKSRDNLLAQYAEITDNCSKRIDALAAMIQQLREDKVRMLQVSKRNVSKDDKDASTSRAELPVYKPNSQKGSKSSKESGSSLDEEEIYNRMMEIDFEFISKMKQLNKSIGSKQEKTSKPSATSTPLLTSIITSEDGEGGPLPKSSSEQFLKRVQSAQGNQDPFLKGEDQGFVSFLSDIPMLPKFEPQEETSSHSNHKRPPPSKGLTSIKKLNGNVTLVPHELSTIVEIESQVSAKAQSPDTTRDFVNAPQQLLVIAEVHEDASSTSTNANESEKYKKSSTSNSKSTSTSHKDDSFKSIEEASSTVLDNFNKSKDLATNKDVCDDNICSDKNKKMLSSSSSDDLESVENMLKSIGMAWAIPTLHKTQEALELTSSSSSLDLSKKKNRSVSTSEISLKEYLRQHILKISSSTMLTDGSLGSFLGESTELSGIPKNSSSTQDKSKQRTSTPLGSSKFTTSKSNEAFSDNELSSIKLESKKSQKGEKEKDKTD